MTNFNLRLIELMRDILEVIIKHQIIPVASLQLADEFFLSEKAILKIIYNKK